MRIDGDLLRSKDRFVIFKKAVEDQFKILEERGLPKKLDFDAGVMEGNPLHIFAKYDDLRPFKYIAAVDNEKFKEMINLENFYKKTPLDIACEAGNMMVACLLFKSGAIARDESQASAVTSSPYFEHHSVKYAPPTSVAVSSVLRFVGDSRGTNGVGAGASGVGY